ncbi:MAG TPA: response regulator [Desulfuromonadaceae bacterium]
MANPHSVLVIDDDPAILLTLTAYLEDSGFSVVKASDGKTGLELFAQLRPDAIVTDLRMPGLDGFEVIAAVKAQSPATPVIAFTGTGEHRESDLAIEMGAWCCLYKPLADLNELVMAINLALEQPNTGGMP